MTCTSLTLVRFLFYFHVLQRRRMLLYFDSIIYLTGCLLLLETETWTTVAAKGEVPSPRYGMTLLLVGNEQERDYFCRFFSITRATASFVRYKDTALLYGGRDDSRGLNDVHMFDFGAFSFI